MRTEDATPEDLDRAVLDTVQTFFRSHRNERWMPTVLVETSLPGVRGRRVRDALIRLTASGRVERAEERPGNPYTRAYRLVTPVRSPTNPEGT
jgi:hypothetical protein